MTDLERLFRKALAHHRAGRLAEAVAGYQSVLAAELTHGGSLHLLGAIAHGMGQTEAALNLMRAALATKSADPTLHNDLGEVCRIAGLTAEAESHLTRSLTLDPTGFGATNNLGLLRHAEGRLDEAIQLYRRALALDKRALAPRTNLGAALTQAGLYQEAAAVLEIAHRRAPKDPAVLLASGNLREALDDPQGAADLYRIILRQDPAHLQAETNLARVLRDLGQPAAALDHYDAVLRRAPDLAQARFNQGLCHLLLGDYAKGWAGWAWRWRAGAVPSHGLPGPDWAGEPLNGAEILVHAEQGIGDTIQFVRFLPDLKDLGAGAITLLVQSGLAGLLQAIPGVDQIVEAGAPVAACRWRIPLLDLPARLGVTPAKLTGTSYLTADGARASAWRTRLVRPERRIGLVWQGRREHANDRNRSIPAPKLQPLLDIPGLTWFGLQPVTAEADRAALPGLVDLGPELINWPETAAAIMALDLVVTVDTSVAHLAGALGRPFWLLLPFAPDWRWGLDREDTPWYGSGRLFRQTRRGDWDGVVAAVRAALVSD